MYNSCAARFVIIKYQYCFLLLPGCVSTSHSEQVLGRLLAFTRAGGPLHESQDRCAAALGGWTRLFHASGAPSAGRPPAPPAGGMDVGVAFCLFVFVYFCSIGFFFLTKTNIWGKIKHTHTHTTHTHTHTLQS
jgi:hypothetical protein